MKNILKKILIKLHILSAPKLKSKTEIWRERGVKIGKNFDGPDSAIDYCFGHLVSIGDNVTISGTTILAHDGSTKKFLGYSKVAPVEIGNNVFIGYGCIVLPGVKIGNNVIVGAGTIISKDIPDNVVVVQGTTTTYRVLCTFEEYIEKQKDNLEKYPIFDTLFSDKTEQQWQEELDKLHQYKKGFDL